MWIKVIYSVGNALLTIGSLLSLGKRAAYFGKRVKHHGQPKYTKKSKPRTQKQDRDTMSNVRSKNNRTKRQ